MCRHDIVLHGLWEEFVISKIELRGLLVLNFLGLSMRLLLSIEEHGVTFLGYLVPIVLVRVFENSLELVVVEQMRLFDFLPFLTVERLVSWFSLTNILLISTQSL